MLIGLIPARGGSKGIPRKNLQEINGVSLLSRGVATLKRVGCERVVVSSEDLDILDQAINSGAEGFIRPSEFAQDDSSTESVLLHFIENDLVNSEDLLLVHQVTSPFLKIENFKLAIELLRNNVNINSCFSGLPDNSFPWVEESRNIWSPEGHSRSHRPRRQELPSRVLETGGFYLAKVSAILDQKCRFPSPTSVIPVSFIESLDIDTQLDLFVAEQLSACLD
jgi:N-acylneuraminate cytidylyltransferase